MTLDSVTYGPGGTEFEAEDCFVDDAHFKISCKFAQGIGTSQTWMVIVDGLESDVSAKTTSYATPVSFVDELSGATKGGEWVTINGTDLGVQVDDSYSK